MNIPTTPSQETGLQIVETSLFHGFIPMIATPLRNSLGQTRLGKGYS